MARLWQEVFGDPDDLTAYFLSLLPEMGAAIIAENEAGLLGAAYILDGLYFDEGSGREHRCGYIYAVAVAEEARSLGIGRTICRSLAELGRQRGVEILCTLPAEESLYRWYENVLGLSCALRRKTVLVSAGKGSLLHSVSPEEYGARREKLLSGKPHIRLNAALLRFAAHFYRSFGGGLYAGETGICAAYGEAGRAYLKELICPAGEEASLAAAVGHMLSAENVVYYLPSVGEGEPYIAAGTGALPADCVWNLSFD